LTDNVLKLDKTEQFSTLQIIFLFFFDRKLFGEGTYAGLPFITGVKKHI